MLQLAAAAATAAAAARDGPCGSPSAGPVLGGVDMVDLYQQYESGTATPQATVVADDQYVDTGLGGYQFRFKSAANLKTFSANRTKYAPQLGGYCAWGLSGDDSHSGPNGGLWYSCTESAYCYDLMKLDPYSGLYFFLAAGPKNNFEADGSKYIPASQKNFRAIAGDGYCFNTDKIQASGAVAAAFPPSGNRMNPDAPCQVKPYNASCCYNDKSAPVLGGVDFVDLAAKKQGTDSPAFGSSSYTAQLNGYTFYFLSQANAATFSADPWAYAPKWGGFCSWGVAGETPDHVPQQGSQWIPAADVSGPYWVRYEGATYMNKGASPMQMLEEDMAGNVQKGEGFWSTEFGSDKSQWPFNTRCCATDTYPQMDICKQ